MSIEKTEIDIEIKNEKYALPKKKTNIFLKDQTIWIK